MPVNPGAVKAVECQCQAMVTIAKRSGQGVDRIKDEHKAKLKLFEEWTYCHDERAAIMEYDGGLSREEAKVQAKVLMSTVNHEANHEV